MGNFQRKIIQKIMNNAYKKAHNLVKTNLNILLHSDMSCMCVLSPAGLGKTTLVLNAMKERNWEQGKHFLYYNSYFTPLSFYQTLDETNNLKGSKVLILDDVETILKNKDIINLLKSATWDSGNKRQVTYSSTTTKIKNKTINFDGKIILLINETPDANPMFKAIVDRTLFCELSFKQKEILSLMETEIVKKPYKDLPEHKRKMVFKFIKKHVTPDTELSFRTLIKAYNNYMFAPHVWKELTEHSLNLNTSKKTNSNNNTLL